jgi:AbrB family looped-hinge helix DNA binding protein
LSEIGTSAVSAKGQVTIPKEIRDVLGLKPGDKVVFIEKENEVSIRRSNVKRLSQILEAQRPWKTSGLGFQSRARKEWE